jgi:regulator of protease activity HflC (stomatin/prohibitin superfamily)
MASRLNVVSATLLVIAIAAGAIAGSLGYPVAGGIAFAVLLFFSASPRIIREWENAVLLRLGKFERLLSPGLVWVVPGIDKVVAVVDMRVHSTPFTAEKTLTKDTVPVNVDAVLFWQVSDAVKAVLAVDDFINIITWTAQTTLRDVIGRTELLGMISDRESLDRELEKIIEEKTQTWGLTIKSVEIRDMIIPGALEDAMSRKAQADREREARIILAGSEIEVARQMVQAADTYDTEPTALRLRAMNMTYESIKEHGALMVIPSGMAESMDPGVIGLATAAFRAQSEGDGT